MKLTKQQLITVIKEELNAMLAEQHPGRGPSPFGAPDPGGWPRGVSGPARPAPEPGPPTLVQDPPRRRRRKPKPTYVSRVGPPMAPIEPVIEEVPWPDEVIPYRGAQPPVVWDGPKAYPDPRFVRDFATFEQDVEAGRAAPSWEEAGEAGDTGWGWGSLEETVKENLANILKELDTAAVSVRVKKLPQSGDPPSPRYLTPAQANLLGPGLKPGTPGEVPEEEWKKGGRVKFAWPRGVKGAGRRKTRYIQKDYLQTDPWG